jgi:hypothetical protein
MKIVETGILSHHTPDSDRAILTFATVTPISNGELLATCRAGSSKDSEDEQIELYRSVDGGRSWSEPRRCFEAPQVAGRAGTLKLCYLTELAPGHLLAAAMWVDRTSYPGQPLFNAETEGCLPMSITLANSFDFGHTWEAWWVVPLPDEIGPASLTNPILKLADGRLALSIETNKHYFDATKWYQRAVLFHSADLGQSWSGPVTVAQDPAGRIFHWDQRLGVAPDGRLGTFIWTYDSQAHRYLNVHRRLSADGGQSWSLAQDLGFPDQAAHPAILSDGRVVLAWVDRFQTQSIRARLAPDIAAAFEPASEVTIYQHGPAGSSTRRDDTGALLAEMSQWSFGLPYAETLPNGEVLVVYYAGTDTAMDIHWTRLGLS